MALHCVTNLARCGVTRDHLSAHKTATSLPASLATAANREAAESLANSFRSVALTGAEEQPVAADEQEDEEGCLQAGNDCCASSCSTSSSSSGAASQLSSPLAAFAAAEARLAHSTSEAGRRVDSMVQRLGLGQQQLTAAVPAAAANRGAAASALALLKLERLLEVPSVGSPSPALAALQKRNSVLKARLSSSSELCSSLLSQVQEGHAAAAYLQESKMDLLCKLREAQLDKARLQGTIRQLTLEAAQLSEQALQALLPAEGEEQADAAAPPYAPPAAAAVPVPAAEENWAKAPVLTWAARGPPAALCLTRDWSSVSSSTSSASSKGSAWHPATAVHDFECTLASTMAAYAQGGSAGSGGQKRRRLECGKLSESLRPALVSLAEESAAAAGPAPFHRAGSLSQRSTCTWAECDGQRSSAVAAGVAAPDAESLTPASTNATPPTQPGDEQCAPALAVGAAQQHGGCLALTAAAEAKQEQRYHTFDLFDSLWLGSSDNLVQRHSLERALVPAPGRHACRRRQFTGCSIM